MSPKTNEEQLWILQSGKLKVCIRYASCSKYTIYLEKVIELSFNSNEFGRVLLVKPSMFGKLEVHVLEVVWRFEPITFYFGELRVKLILATHVSTFQFHSCFHFGNLPGII